MSSVSRTTIKKLEAGTTQEVRPSTLRLLARGFARGFDGAVDREATEELYTRLMRASGFLPPERPRETGGISRDAFIRDMERRTGRRDLAVAMSTVAWDYDEIPEAHRKILEATILGLAGEVQDEGKRAD